MQNVAIFHKVEHEQEDTSEIFGQHRKIKWMIFYFDGVLFYQEMPKWKISLNT